MLVFYRQADGSIEKLTVNRYPLGAPYTSAWQGGSLVEQWQALGDLIVSKNPKRIGINMSADWPVADGLTASLYQQLTNVLPQDWHNRLVSAEKLVVRWLEQRTAQELAVIYSVSLARGVIAEGFSSKVITPGVTTTDAFGEHRLGLAYHSAPAWRVTLIVLAAPVNMP
ncbi:Xaa-Pro aminopeptidase [Alishewanella longhuensis]